MTNAMKEKVAGMKKQMKNNECRNEESKRTEE